MPTEKTEATFLQDLTGIVRKHFGSEKPVEQKFKEVKTADGTAVIAYEGETPEAGMAVVAIVNGEKLSVPDGIHTMEDGSKMETKDSFIVAVTPGEAKPEEKPNPAEVPAKSETPAPTSNPMPMKEVETLIKERHFEEMKPVNEKIVELEAKNLAQGNVIKSLTETVSAQQAALETLTEKFGKYEKFSADVEALLNKPQEQVKPIETQFQKEEKPEAKKLTDAEWKEKYKL